MIAAAPFWDFSAPQIAILLMMLGGFITWFSRFEGRVQNSVAGLKTLSEQTEKTFAGQRQLLDEIAIKINQLDHDGTRKSQQHIASYEKLVELNARRMDKLETIVLDLAPKVAAMAKDVEWIAGTVRKNGSKAI